MTGSSIGLTGRPFTVRADTRKLVLFLILALAVPLAGCGSSSDNGGGAPTPTGPDAGCSTERPRRVYPTTPVEAERQYLDDMVACMNGQTGAVSLTNKSDLVWAFHDSVQASSVTSQSQDIAITEFHLISRNMYQYAFMAPGEEVDIGGSTASLEWAIHPELSAAWTANDFLLEQLKKKGDAAFRLAVTGKSASRQAVWDCTKAVYDVGAKTPEIIESTSYDPGGQIGTVLGFSGSAGGCARSWTAAEREAGSTRVPQWAQVADDVDLALKPAAELSEKATFLKKAVQGTLPLICKVFPRC